MELIKPSKLIVIDCETTGIEKDCDEILQVSIIDEAKNTLYNSYIKPLHAKSWERAQAINHISPEMVKDAPNIYHEMPKINDIFRQAEIIVGYNHIGFDIPFLQRFGLNIPAGAELYDVMLEFATVYGEYNESYGEYKWQKLSTAACYYDYNWDDVPEKAHNSLADCLATLYVYKKMRKQIGGTV